MTAPQSPTQKVCAICHEDCSNRPRIKDPKGHYYCRKCYDAARQRKQARKAVPPPKPKPKPAPVPAPMDDAEDLGLLVDLAEDAATARREEQPASHCPSCEKPMPSGAIVCVECGYNRSIGQHVAPAVAAAAPARARRASGDGIGIPPVLTQPWVVFVVPVAVFGVLALMAGNNESMAMVFALLSLVFGLGVGLWMLVAAFREGVGTGLLTLFVPFYFLYFVFSVNDNPYLKAAVAASASAQLMGHFVL